jgi:anaerobic ribonucleoside-triphosphate reductase activating protein
VTYSGGEPILQCDVLVELNKVLINNELSIVCYTGYTLEELRKSNDPKINEFLSQVDILIDGRYQEANKANLIWRGSKNQRVHFLTGRYRDYQSRMDSEGEIELVVGNDRIRFTGMLQDEIIRNLNDIIKRREK